MIHLHTKFELYSFTCSKTHWAHRQNVVAHVRYHVTRSGTENDPIFGIPDSYLLEGCTTFMRLQRLLLMIITIMTEQSLVSVR